MKPLYEVEEELFDLNIKAEKSLSENDDKFPFSILKLLVSVLFLDETE